MTTENVAVIECPSDVLATTVLAKLAARSAEITDRAGFVDREGRFPAEDVALLAGMGALSAFAVPGVPCDQLMEALRLIGRANLSVGRIFEGHVNAAKLVGRYGSAQQRRQLEEDISQGGLYGVWNTEPAPGVRIEGGPDERLVGSKSFATGAGHIHRAIVTARLPDGGRQMVIADASKIERADPSWWRVRGMKATISGRYDLGGLPVNEDTRLGRAGDYEREPDFSAGAWRFTAVQLGGIERVLMLVRKHMVANAQSDPIKRARFAEALAATRTAFLWVREAARMGEGDAGGCDPIPLVLLARGVVERAGLAVMEAAARLVGTRAFFDDDPIDLACRDLALYLRQPVPDQALDRAGAAFLDRDTWFGDPLW